eukprot:scaffold3341_cov3632-Pavlova_lutheri.AAC.1
MERWVHGKYAGCSHKLAGCWPCMSRETRPHPQGASWGVLEKKWLTALCVCGLVQERHSKTFMTDLQKSKAPCCRAV